MSISTINDETTARHVRKYESRNPLQRRLLLRFHREVRRLLDRVRPRRVLDFGCGEGYFWAMQVRMGPLPEVVGIDLRADAVTAAQARLPGQTFVRADLFEYDPGGRLFDLVVASETLEHLHDPGPYVRRLSHLTEEYLLLTVPHEPFFQLANLCRCRDLPRLGNHPEHVQRWSRRSFIQFLEKFVIVEDLCVSFPFLLALCRRRC